MRKCKIVLLSGPICSGKTNLAENLKKKFGYVVIKSTVYVSRRMGARDPSRKNLQSFGQRLDRTIGGTWLLEDSAKEISDLAQGEGIIVESVRTKEQIEAFRSAYLNVLHVHLNAPFNVLRERYSKKFADKCGEFTSYEDTQRNRTEKNIDTLKHYSDISINTDRCNECDVLERVASLMGLYGNSHERLVDVLVGGQYGSEGKGNVASYLANEYDYLVRVGGPNAGHTVKLNSAAEYTFRQLPSGSKSSDAKLIIGAGAVIDPEILIKEINDNSIDINRLFIDPKAMIIEPRDRIFETNGLKKDISSTASGAGMAAARRIMYRGKDKIKLAKDIPLLKPYIKPSLEIFEQAYSKGKKIFLEGTQGTGLSLYHGHYPHVTSRDTTVSGCLAEAGISSIRVRRVIMVCRTYPIRVPDSLTGKTSGAMSQNVTREQIAERSGVPLSDLAELTSVTKGKRRIGEFDWQLLRKSTALNSPTDVALTFADYISVENRKARRFDQLTSDTINFIEEIERFAKAPVSLISTRFHIRSIIDRRSW